MQCACTTSRSVRKGKSKAKDHEEESARSDHTSGKPEELGSKDRLFHELGLHGPGSDSGSHRDPPLSSHVRRAADIEQKDTPQAAPARP